MSEMVPIHGGELAAPPPGSRRPCPGYSRGLPQGAAEEPALGAGGSVMDGVGVTVTSKGLAPDLTSRIGACIPFAQWPGMWQPRMSGSGMTVGTVHRTSLSAPDSTTTPKPSLPAGTGTIHCAHGEMPNPAPATLELLAGMTLTQTAEPYELVTPTGAALLRVWTHTLAPLPKAATVLRSAFGFGSRTLTGRPNVLRATLLAESASVAAESAADLLVLETNLDDCNPEWIGALTSDLLDRGALDVWHTPVVMKKGRSGTMLSVLASSSDAAVLRERIFRCTTTFGVRYYPVQRETLKRRFENVSTPWGEVPVKIGALRGEDITASPEHEACAALAQACNVTARQVYDAAKRALKR